MSARVRIALVLSGIVAAVTACLYLIIVPHVSRQALDRIDSQLVRQLRLFESNKRIEAVDSVNLAERLAAEQTLVAALRDKDHAKGFEEIQAQNVRLQERSAAPGGQPGRKADLIALIGVDGKLLVRDTDPSTMRDEDVGGKYPGAAAGLKGEPNRDLWNLRGAMYRVAVAPVRDAGAIIGAVAVGFVVGAADARADADLLGSEVVYYAEKRIFAASLQDQDKSKELERQIGADANLLAMGKGQALKPLRFNLKGEDFRGVAMPMPAVKSAGPAVMLMASEGVTLAGLATVKLAIFLGGIVMLILVLAAWATISRHFMKPLEELEQTTTEIINGRLEAEYRIFVDEFEGLANALNTMVSKLTGRPEEGSDAEAWAGDPLFIEELDVTTLSAMAAVGPDGRPIPASGLDQTVAELAREPEAQYYARIFKEYSEARRKLGHPESMNFDRFVEKTRQNEQQLCAKYRCRMVRFQVMLRPDNVTLKPIPIDPQA
jgi:HAMP domain-containing protein